MRRYAAVLFDLDGTLCRHNQSPSTLFQAAFDNAGVERFGDPSDLWAALDGPVDPDDERGYLADGFERLAASYGRTVDALALADGFIADVDNTDVSFLPGAEAALERAVEWGPVALVTNGPEHRQATKLRALGIVERFDTIVYAGDMPRRKPHPAPFDRALAELAVGPDDAVHVGDSLEYDVVGAQAAGVDAAWCPEPGDSTDPGSHRPEYVLASLHEFANTP